MNAFFIPCVFSKIRTDGLNGRGKKRPPRDSLFTYAFFSFKKKPKNQEGILLKEGGKFTEIHIFRNNGINGNEKAMDGCIVLLLSVFSHRYEI